jgi:hypothetical protein
MLLTRSVLQDCYAAVDNSKLIISQSRRLIGEMQAIIELTNAVVKRTQKEPVTPKPFDWFVGYEGNSR